MLTVCVNFFTNVPMHIFWVKGVHGFHYIVIGGL